MAKIQLIYVENLVSRKRKLAYQTLSFFMRLDNISYDKQVTVVWADEDGEWQSLAAHYHSTLDSGREYWVAEIKRKITSDKALPKAIQFSLHYQVLGQDYWDNNQGWNYHSQTNSGISLINTPVLNLSVSSTLKDRQKSIPISVATDKIFNAEKVIIHWTIDNWQQVQQTACVLKPQKKISDKLKSNAQNSDIWQARINIGQGFRLQYCIACENTQQTVWDNNDGNNYSLSYKALSILILNLHCYQEDHQDYKLSQIAKAINEHHVDIVCLQEVAEHWNNGQGDWDSNSANIINKRLTKPFHLYTDWSHLGFDKYREGVAILSRYPFVLQASQYVSDSHDAYSIHSRKVVMGQIQWPYLGLINVFSAHLSWWEDGFQQQFQRLSAWAKQQQSDQIKATLLCGDFNITAGSIGYSLVVDLHQYDDQFLAINSPGIFEKIFKVNDSHWQHYLADDYRIDFIFMDKTSELMVKSGTVLFTDQDYGKVSDHCGYLMTFEPQ